MKKLSSLFLVFIITSTLFIGCGNNTSNIK